MQFAHNRDSEISAAQMDEAKHYYHELETLFPNQLRAIVFDHHGGPDVMSLRDVPIPEPQDGEVLIRVRYAGVNPSDSKARSGQSARGGYRYREVGFPFVTGMDAAGIV